MIGISAGPLALPVDPQVLAAYAGRYKVSNDIVVTIRIDGTRVLLQIPNQPGYDDSGEYELFAVSEDQFYLWGETNITFYRNASGEVDRLVCVLSGVTYEAKKVP